MSTKSDTVERVNALTTAANVSPYRLGKIGSVLRGKEIPPQKLYGYVRQGYIKATLNELGKMQIAQEEARRYLLKTLSNNS